MICAKGGSIINQSEDNQRDELTARLRRAVSPTRVSMKAKNPFRLYLVMQLYAAP